jgi:hypothetical protein
MSPFITLQQHLFNGPVCLSRIPALIDRQTKANEFEGTGGPEDKIDEAVRDRPGDDDVTANVR